MQPSKRVTVESLWKEHKSELGLRLVAGSAGLQRLIREPTVNRPGLMLAGFEKYFAQHRVQVIGNAEMHYLRSLSVAERERRLGALFATRIPCLVFCRGYRPDTMVVRLADAAGVPVFRSPHVTMKFINQATLVLEELFAPTVLEIGSMVDILGIGVILRGAPGIGKSECVLGLIERGYSLVADDSIRLRLREGRELIGTSPQVGQNFMEVRGIGIIDVPAMFGVKSIRTEKRVDLVITLTQWDASRDVERVGLEHEKVRILGIEIPHLTIPVRVGRDLARLVEVAAFHAKLGILGYNPAEVFNTILIDRMQREAAAKAQAAASGPSGT